MKKMSPKVIRMWRIRLFLAAVIPSFLAALLWTPASRAYWIATIFWAGILLGACFGYLPLWYSRFSYGLDGENLTVSRGVLFRQVKRIRIANIQYLTLTSTPLQRLFGLSTLTASAAGSFLLLQGLEEGEARRLRDYLAMDGGGEGDAHGT